jgi:hypothetical protein
MLKCSILFVVLTNKNEGVAVTQTDVFIYQFTTYFGPDMPPSRDY